MSLKKYYNILGLPDTADNTAVRKQFRKLAMKFHPDKNPLPQAKEHFLQITEAYEILTGKIDAPKSGVTISARKKEKTQEERIKEAKLRYQEQVRKEQIENDLYFKSLFKGRKWRTIKLASVVGTLLSLIILLDYFLPRHYTEDSITHYAKNIYSGRSRTNYSILRTKNNKEYWTDHIDYSLCSAYPNVYIEETWIFHQPIRLISIQKVRFKEYPLIFTFYSVGLILIFAFILPILVRLFKRKTVFYTIMYHICLYIIPILIVIFLVANDHWAHLLTLGFL